MAQLDPDDVAAIIDGVVKALPGGVAQASGQSPVPQLIDVQQLLAAISQNGDERAQASLPRMQPQVPFGPGIPPFPGYLDPRFPDTDRPPPRISEYPVGWNLPGQGQRSVPFTVLRSFSEQVSVVRRCIEIRSNRLCSVDWTVAIRPDVIEAEAQRSGQSRTDVRQAMTAELQPEIDRLRSFWEMPDRLKRLTFSDWQALLLEEHFVHDGLSIYPHPTLNGDLHSFEILDGTTIKPLLDYRGTVPQPPEPAYQQILYGFPRGEFTLDERDDARPLQQPTAAAPYGLGSSDVLVYRPFKRRTFTPYGYSPCEMALTEGDLWLKRLSWVRAGFTDGTTSAGYLLPKSDTDWDIEQIRQFSAWINAELSGQTALRQQLKSLPPGWDLKFPPDFAERYEANFDEHLVKLLCWPFGVMPTELGITPKAGLGGSGHQAGEAASAERNADKPYLAKLTDLYNELSVAYLGMHPALTFNFELDDDTDDATRVDSSTKRLDAGLTTLNRELADAGEPLYDFEEANEPFVMTATGPVFLRGLIEKSAAADEAQQQLAAQTHAALTGGPQPPPTAEHEPPNDQGSSKPPPTSKPSQEGSTGPEKEATVSKAAELRTFARFAERRQGRAWRDFDFEHVDAGLAAQLNEWGADGQLDLVKAACGADVLKAAAHAEPESYAANRSKIIEHFAPQLGKAFAKSVDADGIASRWLQHVHSSSPSDAVAAARHFLAGEHTDTSDALDVLRSITANGYAAGVAGGLHFLGKLVVPDLVKAADDSSGDLVLADGEDGFTWDDWQPGYGEAALQAWGDAGGRGLRQLLDDAGITIQSIDDTNMDGLAELLGQSLAEGTGSTALAGQIRDLLSRPDRAEMVARTETARAMTVATRDEYAEHDVEKVQWLLSPGACVLCEENADAGAIDRGEDFPNGDVPVHPNCVCAIAPA